MATVPSPKRGEIWLVRSKDSGADAFQVKSVSETRFVRKLGEVTAAQIDDISSAIALCVGAP